VDSTRAEKILRLASVIKPIYDKHRQQIQEMKASHQHWNSPDFIWEALLLSFSTMGSARGFALFRDEKFHGPVRYAQLLRLSPSERKVVLHRCLKEAGVRWFDQKTTRLIENFERIQRDGGPEAVKRELCSHEGRELKMKFLRTFKGIGEKYARNMMMDVYHEDFRNSIAIDDRLNKAMKAVGLSFNGQDYREAEEFFLEVAQIAGLENGWELDRLIFNHLPEVLEAIKNSK